MTNIVSPYRSSLLHRGEVAMHAAGAVHRSETRYGARWVRDLAPLGATVAPAPFVGLHDTAGVSALASATVADVVAMAPALYSAAMRLATSAARRGRYCGGRGRRAQWGADGDTGGMVPLPVARDSGDDDEAATDALGVAWSRAAAGRYGAPDAPMPWGKLYTLARNLGRLRAVRRIRESAPLVGTPTDRMLPSDADGRTVAELLAMVPPERRGAAAQALAGSTSTERSRRSRMAPVSMPEGATVVETVPEGGWIDPVAVNRNASVDTGVP